MTIRTLAGWAGWLGLIAAGSLSPGRSQEAPDAAAPAPSPALAESAAPVVLTNLEQVVARRVQAAEGSYSAEFEGVVIYVSGPQRRIHVQSGDDCAVVFLDHSAARFQPAQRVRVRGKVAKGPLAVLQPASAVKLADAALPEPKEVSPFALVRGEEPFRYTTVRGHVRNLLHGKQAISLHLAQDGMTFEVLLPEPAPPLPPNLFDAEVKVTGFSWPRRNAYGRAVGFRFQAVGTNPVQLLSPGVTNAFAHPLLTVREAARQPQISHTRVRARGVVTAAQPDKGFFIDDGSGVLRVVLLPQLPNIPANPELEREPQTTPEPGEQVEVVGLRYDGYSLTPTLAQAEFRRMGRRPEIQPLRVEAAELQSGRHSGKLVTLTARLLDLREYTGRSLTTASFVFQSGDVVFQGRCQMEQPARWTWTPHAYVRITGINDVEGSSVGSGKTFQLLLRSPADLVPSAEPPFWTRPDLRRIGLGAGMVAVVAVAFLLLQRRQVQQLERRVDARTADLSDANRLLQTEVSARQKAETDLRVALAAEKELNQLKSSFISMVTHEFRTPLEVILSSSHILDRYLDRLPPEQRHEQLRAIRASVHRMSDLMEDVLTLGKFEAARMTCHPQPLDLAQFSRRCVEEIETATQNVCPIRVTIEDLDGPARADVALLGPILNNLLANAVKYSPRGAPVQFTVARNGDLATFVIRDQGIGIPAADLPRLFTAFHRAGNVGQIPGSGLGLVIVKRCAELHGGTVVCASSPPQGSTFTVQLPLFTVSPQPDGPAVPVPGNCT